MRVVSIFLILFVLLTASVIAEEAPQSVVTFVNDELLGLGTDPVIVKAVKAENAQGKNLNQIKTKDEDWKGTPGIADYMKAIMTSPCGQHLKKIQDSYGFIAEIFVMDDQGANVAMTDKTSDYWQGDEAKFEKSYNGGSGGVFIDEVEFDESTQAYLVQASFPVKDGGKVIGAITVGINIDEFEAR